MIQCHNAAEEAEEETEEATEEEIAAATVVGTEVTEEGIVVVTAAVAEVTAVFVVTAAVVVQAVGVKEGVHGAMDMADEDGVVMKAPVGLAAMEVSVIFNAYYHQTRTQADKLLGPRGRTS